MNQIELLKSYRDLKISKANLLKELDVKSLNEVKHVVVIECVHVVKLLESFKAKFISEEELLDWVNTVWFSDAYDYSDKEMDSISSVMNKLEEIDEGINLDDDEIELFIQSLKENKEIDNLD